MTALAVEGGVHDSSRLFFKRGYYAADRLGADQGDIHWMDEKGRAMAWQRPDTGQH